MSLGQRIREVVLWISGLLVPAFQFVPNTWMFWGYMSMPLIAYFSSLGNLSHLGDEIGAMLFDFSFLYGWHGLSELAGVVLIGGLVLIVRAAILGGLLLSAYSLCYLCSRRSGLVTTGPYAKVRHPQYLGFVLLTGGITVFVMPSGPVWVWGKTGGSVAAVWIPLIWLLEVAAYIVLAKIEEAHLRRVHGEEYLRYAGSVPFMLPLPRRRTGSRKSWEQEQPQ